MAMTIKEWKEKNPGISYCVRWAADTFGGFGKKGNSAYGDCDDCEIIFSETMQNGNPMHYIWDTKRWGRCPEES